MKHKSLIRIMLIVLHLLPATVFASEWTWQNPLPTGNNLYGVLGSSATDVLFVSNAGTILHYDENLWDINMQSGDLSDVWGSSASDVFAVGGYGIILHFDGSTWSEMYSDSKQWFTGV
jgi:hypothetical protein